MQKLSLLISMNSIEETFETMGGKCKAFLNVKKNLTFHSSFRHMWNMPGKIQIEHPKFVERNFISSQVENSIP